jgi:hypothetical protein
MRMIPMIPGMNAVQLLENWSESPGFNSVLDSIFVQLVEVRVTGEVFPVKFL